jgi:hypothetical protein
MSAPIIITVDLTDDERMQLILALGCRMGIEYRDNKEPEDEQRLERLLQVHNTILSKLSLSGPAAN